MECPRSVHAKLRFLAPSYSPHLRVIRHVSRFLRHKSNFGSGCWPEHCRSVQYPVDRTAHDPLTVEGAPACMRTKLLKYVLLLTVLCFATIGFTQDSSSMTGVVTDPSGAVIPGTTVTLSNPSTGVTLTQVTDSKGSYRFVNCLLYTSDAADE